MDTVTRTTTFDLNDSTGDYLELDIGLTIVEGEVWTVEITRAELVDFDTGLITEWDLAGDALAQYGAAILRDVQEQYKDCDIEIAASLREWRALEATQGETW